MLAGSCFKRKRGAHAALGCTIELESMVSRSRTGLGNIPALQKAAITSALRQHLETLCTSGMGV